MLGKEYINNIINKQQINTTKQKLNGYKIIC